MRARELARVLSNAAVPFIFKTTSTNGSGMTRRRDPFRAIAVADTNGILFAVHRQKNDSAWGIAAHLMTLHSALRLAPSMSQLMESQI
jgi:hypothetical protein